MNLDFGFLRPIKIQGGDHYVANALNNSLPLTHCIIYQSPQRTAHYDEKYLFFTCSIFLFHKSLQSKFKRNRSCNAV